MKADTVAARGPSGPAALVFLVLTLSSPAVGLGAGEAPRKLEVPTFTVAVTDRSGALRDSFSRGAPPHLDMTFVLALSASSRYATSITVIQDANGRITEDVLFEGNLEEGVYQFVKPLPPPAGGGEILVKAIMKTRFFPKKFTGESIYIYRNWEGTYRYGK